MQSRLISTWIANSIIISTVSLRAATTQWSLGSNTPDVSQPSSYTDSGQDTTYTSIGTITCSSSLSGNQTELKVVADGVGVNMFINHAYQVGFTTASKNQASRAVQPGTWTWGGAPGAAQAVTFNAIADFTSSGNFVWANAGADWSGAGYVDASAEGNVVDVGLQSPVSNGTTTKVGHIKAAATARISNAGAWSAPVHSVGVEGNANTTMGLNDDWDDSSNQDCGAYSWFTVSFNTFYTTSSALSSLTGKAQFHLNVSATVQATGSGGSGYAESEVDLDGEAKLTATFPN